jgi:hypothetical protein
MSHWCLVKFQSSTYRLPVFLVSFVEEAIFSPKCVLGTFAENQVAAAAWVYFYSILFYSILFYSILFYSIPWVYMSVFVPVPCCFCYYGCKA